MTPSSSPRRRRLLVSLLTGLSLVAALLAANAAAASAAPSAKKKAFVEALCGTVSANWTEGTIRPITAGVAVHTRGERSKAVKGMTVTVQRKTGGRWVTLVKGRTNSRGYYTKKVVLRGAGQLILRCKLTYSKKFKKLRKLQQVLRVDDHSTVDRRSTASLAVQGTPYSDERTVFTGSVSPVGIGRVVRVSLEPRSPGAQSFGIGSDYQDIAVRPDGTFSFSRQLMGQWSVRADVLRSTDYNAYTRSNAVSVSTGSHDGLSIAGAGGSLPTGAVGQDYSYTFVLSDSLSSGRTGRWSLTSGSLPAGLELVGDTIVGTPTTAGTSTFTVAFTDAQNARVRATMTLQVDGPP